MAYQVDGHTVSLLHFDNGIKDETGKVWTVKGAATVSGTQSKFGSSALYLESDGSAISIESPLKDFHSSPYTIEMWIYPTSRTGGSGNQVGSLAGFTGIPSDYASIALDLHKDTGVISGLNCVSSNKASFNSWNHVAMTFDGKTTRLFLNGKLEASTNELRTVTNAGTLVVGTTANKYTAQYYGYIDELRISNIARWTGDFDPENPPVNPPDSDLGRNLLTVTLAEEVEREYALTKEQVDAFVNWYIDRSAGKGAAFYTFDKSFSRKDYLPFDKIITFELTDFTK